MALQLSWGCVWRVAGAIVLAGFLQALLTCHAAWLIYRRPVPADATWHVVALQMPLALLCVLLFCMFTWGPGASSRSSSSSSTGRHRNISCYIEGKQQWNDISPVAVPPEAPDPTNNWPGKALQLTKPPAAAPPPAGAVSAFSGAFSGKQNQELQSVDVDSAVPILQPSATDAVNAQQTTSAQKGSYSSTSQPAHVPPCSSNSSSHSDGNGLVDVWILAGQSNCVGCNGPDGQILPEVAAPWPGKILAYNNRDCVWQDAVANVHLHIYSYEDAYSCGPDMAFARTLITLGMSDRVGLVPTAMGATSLAQQWIPGGLLWNNMVRDARNAMTTLGDKGRLKGIIWVQGESDAIDTVQTALSYGENITKWLEATRVALGAYNPQLPMVMAVMSTRDRHFAFPFIDVVRAQQQALQLPGLLKIDMAGYEFYEQDFYGHQQLIHLSKAGACALGAAMAYEVAAKTPVAPSAADGESLI